MDKIKIKLNNKMKIDIIRYIILFIFIWLMIFPLFIMISTSLKSESEIYLQEGLNFLPKKPMFINYINTLKVANWGRYFFNSIFITFITVIGSLFLNSLAGYSFGILKFPLRNALFLLLLVGIMVPPQSIIIPQFIIIKSIPLFGGNNILGRGGIGWLDSYWALIVPQLAGSFGVFLCRQYYVSIPYELYESARIDGCNSFTAFIKVYLPLSKPVFASLAILKSVFVWNDFFYPLIMTTSDKMRTVQLGLQSYRSFALFRWDLLMAACTINLIPLLIVFLIFQRYFIQDEVTSGIKG